MTGDMLIFFHFDELYVFGLLWNIVRFNILSGRDSTRECVGFILNLL